MSIKKHTWIPYGRHGGDMIHIILRGSDGSRIDSFKFVKSDENSKKRVLSILRDKYGVDLQTNKKEEPEEKIVDWLDPNFTNI